MQLRSSPRTLSRLVGVGHSSPQAYDGSMDSESLNAAADEKAGELKRAAVAPRQAEAEQQREFALANTRRAECTQLAESLISAANSASILTTEAILVDLPPSAAKRVLRLYEGCNKSWFGGVSKPVLRHLERKRTRAIERIHTIKREHGKFLRGWIISHEFWPHYQTLGDYESYVYIYQGLFLCSEGRFWLFDFWSHDNMTELQSTDKYFQPDGEYEQFSNLPKASFFEHLEPAIVEFMATHGIRLK